MLKTLPYHVTEYGKPRSGRISDATVLGKVLGIESPSACSGGPIGPHMLMKPRKLRDPQRLSRLGILSMPRVYNI
jgi:hypothetical protein